MRFGQIVLFLQALTQPHPGGAAGYKGVERVQQLEGFGLGIFFRIQKCQHAAHAHGIIFDQNPQAARRQRHAESQQPERRARHQHDHAAGGADQYRGADINLRQNQQQKRAQNQRGKHHHPGKGSPAAAARSIPAGQRIDRGKLGQLRRLKRQLHWQLQPAAAAFDA